MTSAYQLIRDALAAHRRVAATYRGHRREMCPYAVGHTDGEERALVLQVGGDSASGLPPGGAWRCLRVEELTDVAEGPGAWVRAADWSAGDQTCVAEIDAAVG